MLVRYKSILVRRIWSDDQTQDFTRLHVGRCAATVKHGSHEGIPLFVREGECVAVFAASLCDCDVFHNYSPAFHIAQIPSNLFLWYWKAQQTLTHPSSLFDLRKRKIDPLRDIVCVIPNFFAHLA